MSTTADLIRIVLLALLAGMAVPILVQLFITLRALQRVSLSVDRRVEKASRELEGVLAGLRAEPRGSDTLGVLAGALVPAVIAGVRAFRATPANHVEPNTAVPSPNQEKTS